MTKQTETTKTCPQCGKRVRFLVDLHMYYPARGKACAGCAWKHDHGVPLNGPPDRRVNPRGM